MTSPVPTSSTSRPGNRRLAAATAILLAGLTLYAASHRSPPINVHLCTIGDTAAPQVVANIAGTDTLVPIDSAFIAHLDSASLAQLHAGVVIAAPCNSLVRDSVASAVPTTAPP